MPEKDDKSKKPASTGAWHAVHIAAGPNACEAVLALGKQRFLSRQAPKLPLAECTKTATCQCAYRHHKDRRSGPRRWSDQGGGNRPRPEGERREKRGRRTDD
jgi:hypothetical protein